MTDPFPKTLWRDLDKCLYELTDAGRIIEKARNCGFNCDEEETQCQSAIQLINALKREFQAPTGPK